MAPRAHTHSVSGRIEDMSPPPLRLSGAAPGGTGFQPVLEPRARADRPAPRCVCPPPPCDPIPYADFLRRQNAIDRKVDDPRLPYADYLRSLPPRPATARPTPSDGPARPEALPPPPRPGVPRLADISPAPIVRRELEVQTTYRIEVPLTSGRLIDIVM